MAFPNTKSSMRLTLDAALMKLCGYWKRSRWAVFAEQTGSQVKRLFLSNWSGNNKTTGAAYAAPFVLYNSNPVQWLSGKTDSQKELVCRHGWTARCLLSKA